MGNIFRKYWIISGQGKDQVKFEWNHATQALDISVKDSKISSWSTAGATNAVAKTIRNVVGVCGNAKVGLTAGWVITAADNVGHATLPASQTASTLIIPITGLELGDTLTGVTVVGQVESAGGIATLSLDVRKLLAAAADLTNTSLGSKASGNMAADTKLDDATGLVKVTGLAEAVVADASYFALLTGTTAALTDIDIMSMIVTRTRL